MANPPWLERTELLLGPEKLHTLAQRKVMVIGLGGVGSYAAEFIARAGVGHMVIVDGDVVDRTNINRQLPAVHSSIGQGKAQWMAARLLDINPELHLHTVAQFLEPDAIPGFIDQHKPDYVLDCIDSITPKLTVIHHCVQRGIPVVSSMGAGGKTDPSQIKVTDVSKTFNCPMAHLVRKKLRQRYQLRKGVKAVFSTELPNRNAIRLTDGSNFKKSFYGTASWIPACFGIHAASTALRDLMQA